MISLGSVNWGSSPVIPITFSYEKRRSGADMQYRVQITVSPITGSSFFGYPIYVDLNIGGTSGESRTVKDANPSRWTSAITYTSGWHTISNKTSGTTLVSFKMYSGLGSSRNSTYTYSMPVDPAASAVSAPNGTLATTLNLTVTKYNTGFTHTITYACGTVSGTVCTKATSTTVAWDNTNGNVLALASQNTSGQSVSVTFTITTYNGASVVGTDSTTVTMAIPNGVKPSVAVKVEDAAGYLATYGAYVQGWSKLQITATPTLAYESPIKAYAITADGKTYNSSPVTTAAVQGKDLLQVTAKVTDARSHTSEVASAEIFVLEYHKPSVNVIAYRCDPSGVEDAEGAYMKIGFTASIASLNGKNSASYTIRYGYSSITGNGTSYTSDPIACDVSRVWSVEVTVSDTLDKTTATATIPIAFTLMDFHNSGEGVALGKVATRKGFDCAMDAYFTGSVTVGSRLLIDLIYPVGSIYMSVNNVSPQAFFGGTWERIQDRFLLAAGSTYTAGGTGGEAAHLLTKDEMPSHAHDRITYSGNSEWSIGDDTGLGGSQTGTYVKRYYEIDHAITASSGSLWATNSIGGNVAHNNMPPYLAVYMWKRIN